MKIKHYQQRSVVLFQEMMETVCKTTHGKMYNINETHKLIKMTQNTVWIIQHFS